MRLRPPARCRRVFGHGFLTRDGLKMGKALGNTLDPGALVATYGADAVRLYFMKEIIFGCGRQRGYGCRVGSASACHTCAWPPAASARHGSAGSCQEAVWRLQ